MTPLRLRLFHAADGTRVAYREAGVGPGLVLLHSAGLSHREFEPVVEHLTHRFRLDPARPAAARRLRGPSSPSRTRSTGSPRSWPRSASTPAGPRPLVAGHGAGAQVLLRAVANGRLHPGRLVIMPTRLHRPPQHPARRDLVRAVARAGSLPGLDRAIAHAAQDGRPAGAGHEAHGPQQPRRARSRPPRDGRRRRQPEPRALVGARRARAGRAARSARCSTSSGAWTCPSCCCGPTRTTRTR